MSAIKYTLPKDAAGLEAIQATAVKSVQNARVSVQKAAVATIYHAFKHGDWTYAGKLVDALGNTVNQTALIEWFKVYGGLKTDDTGFIGWSGPKHIENMFNEAKAKFWWELKAKNPFKGFNLEEALQRVIKDATATKAKIVGLTAEDQAKVHMEVNDATIRAVLKLCNFDAIIGEEPVDQPLGDGMTMGDVVEAA
ncbi:hypothetical protein D3C84_105080 [compost metagenome]